MPKLRLLVPLIVLGPLACSSSGTRGIADSKNEYQRFVPMKQDPARDGLKAVPPYFKSANRTEILRAIERACQGGRAGSAVTNARTGAGYYVNCNPRNRQLLNGYVPINPKERPHSHE